MLDIRRMEVLAAAVRQRSLAGAARSLGITPSAASQAVGALEAQAGTALLERRARGVVPTAAGERLALQAEAVLAQLAAAEAELSGDRTGVLRVAAFATAVSGLLPQVLHALGEPSVPGGSTGQRVEILELEPAEARAAVRSGEVDIALVNHDAELAPDTRGPWRVLHIIDEPVLAVVQAAHRLARARTIDLGRLAQEDWIMQAAASPCQELTLRACAAQGFAPSVSATCADYRSIVRLIEVGHGVSLVPRLALAHLDCRGVAARRTRLPLTRRINALVPVEQADKPSVRRLVTLLREVAAEELTGTR